MKADPLKDQWDWPYILYIGRVWLKYTDKEIWEMTPRKFKSQLDVHYDIQVRSGKFKDDTQKVGFIDQVPGW